MKHPQKPKTPLGKSFLILTTALSIAYLIIVGVFVIYFLITYGIDYSCAPADEARDICSRNSPATNAIFGSMLFIGICLPAIIIWIALAVVMARRKILTVKLRQ